MAIDMSGIWDQPEEEQAPPVIATESVAEGPEQPTLDVGMGKGAGGGQGAAGGGGGNPSAKKSPVDAYTASLVAGAFTPDPVEHPKPKAPHPGGYAANRAEAEHPDKFWEVLQSTAGIPTKQKIAHLQKYLETPSVDMTHMKEAPLTGAYQLAQLAEAEGYKVVFQSGARQGGSKSYHDHGEAVDVRFQQVLSNGKVQELTPRENVELGKRLGKQAGWGSALDEFHFWSDGSPKSDPWNNAPHVHLSWGNETGFAEHDQMHTTLNKRHWKDPNYLVQPVYKQKGFQPTKPAKDRNDRSGVAGMVETQAIAMGIDPDIAVGLVSAESGFNEKAVSPTGAVGLVQMQPETLREVAPKIGITEEEFYTSKRAQIKAGMYYLKEKLQENGGNYARALAAYNAGSGGLANIIKGDDYKETKDYVYKILKERDPSINSPEDALAAIRNGTGRTRDVNKDRKTAQDVINGTRRQAQDFWKALEEPVDSSFDINVKAGKAALKAGAQTFNPLETESLKDPLSGKRRMTGLLNEMLHDATFGIIPLFESTLETQKEHAEIVGDWNNPLSIEGVGEYATTLGLGGLRAWAGAMTGGILAKGLRMLPVVGPWLQGADKTSRALTALGEAPGVLEGGSLFSKVNNMLKGTPMELFKANLFEQVASGAVAMGTYSASKRMWENPGNLSGLEYLKDIVAEGYTGATLGGKLGLGLGLGLPLFGGAALITANRLTGLGSANMADNALMNIANHFGQLNAPQRTLAGTGLGVIGGALTGAALDVTSMDDALMGREVSGSEAMMAGAQLFGGIGAGAGLGYNKLGSMVDQVMASKLMNMPGVAQVRGSIKSWVETLNEKTVRMMSQELLDTQAKNLNAFKSTVAEANATLYSKNLGSTIEVKQASLTQQASARDRLQAEVMQLKQQGQLFQQGEQQLLQRYPLASAFESNRAMKLAELKALGQDPNKAARAAELQADIKNLTDQAKTDKDLSRELSRWNTDKAHMTQAKASWTETLAKKQDSLDILSADVKGIEFSIQENLAAKSLLDAELEGAKAAPGSAKFKPELKLENPAFVRKEARTALLNPGAEDEVQLEAISGHIQRQVRNMLENRSKGINSDLTHLQGAKGAFAGEGDYHQAVQKKVADLKKSVAEIEAMEAGMEAMTLYKSPQRFGKWADSQLQRWSSDVPKDHRLASVDARALQAGLLEELEKGGAALDRNALWTEASKLAKDRYSAAGAKTPIYDKSQMLDLLKEAGAALHLGEKEVPVALSKANLKEFKALIERGKSLSITQSKEAALKELADIEKVFAPKSPLAAVNPITTGAEGEPVPGDLAEGAILDDVLDPNASWPSAARRTVGLETQIKEKLGVYGDLEAYRHFINSGNVSFLPEEVKAFVKSGGDITKAPPSVKAWSEVVTLARVEEVKRMRRLQDMLRGTSDDGAVMAQIRNAQAAGYSPPAYGMTPDPFMKGMKIAGDYASQYTEMTSKNLMEIATSDNKRIWEQVAPLSLNAFNDHLYSRMNALAVVQERMMAPEFARIEKNLMATIKDKGLKYELDGLYKEFSAAVEDTGKLIKFKENYPEAEEMVNFYYGMQDYMESVVAMSPHLKPWVQANYLPHRFRKLASHISAARADEQLSMAAAVSDGSTIGKFRSLEEVEEAVKGINKEISAAGFESEEEFLNLGISERAKRFKFPKDSNMDEAWNSLTPLERKEAEEEVTKKAVTLLLQDPVTNPLELVNMQMSSLFRADSQRRFLGQLANTPAAVDAQGTTLRLVERADKTGLHVIDAKGNQQTYKYLKEVPGFAGVELEMDGETRKAHEIKIHPEVHRFLTQFAMGSGYAENGVIRGAQRLQSIFRQATLLGSMVPHQLNTLSGHLMEFASTPIKAMKMMVGATNLGAGERYTQAAMMANAVRSGLNVRTLERSSQAFAETIFKDFGPDVVGKLAGLEDSTVLKVLQAHDSSDPKAALAKKALKDAGGLQKLAGNVADVTGLAPSIDHMVNGELLFRPIELGQLAGLHMRAERYLMQNLDNPALAHLSGEERMRLALKEAAYHANMAAGALPHFYQNNRMRQVASATLLTPSWLMTKAYALTDTVDAVGHLLTGKSVASLFGRRPFDQLPEAARKATRERMAGMMAAGLIGSYAMTQAAQYFANGTFTTDHPPDKLFHIKVGNEYVTGPVMGYVKDVLRFGVDVRSSTGITEDMGAESIYKAAVNAFTRQLNPSIENMAKSLFLARKGEVLEAPDLMASFINSVASELGGAPLETMGVDKKMFKLENAPGYLGLGGEEKKAAAKNSMLKSRHYLMQQAGLYSSPDNLDMQIRGEFYNRKRDLEFRARGQVAPLLAKAKHAETAEDQNRFLSAAYDQFYKGVPIRDKFMLEYMPEGVYRLSDKEFESLVLEHFNPQAKSIQGVGNTPLGMMVAKTQSEYSGR